jgi:hypothetical protein
MADAATIPDPPIQISEERHTSAGNVYRLLRWSDNDHVMVERVRMGNKPVHDWDKGVAYRWSISQWESIPLVGEKSDDPTFGLFIP